MSAQEVARERLEQAEAALATWDEAHKVGPTDPGLQSMRFHESQAKRSKKLKGYLNQLGRESRERDRLVLDVEKAKRAARAAAIPSEPVDPAELVGATAVMVVTRGHAEWCRVVRVNKTTVTCWAPPGFDQPRHPHSRIYAVRHAEMGKSNG